MPELDDELLSKVTRWCAEAGRQTGTAEIAAALGSLGWDELLAVRALLADPPPARPLGPFALADIARGAPPDVAAERQREGRYRSDEEAATAAAPVSPEPPAVAPAATAPVRRERRAARSRGPAPVVVRRARDRAPAAAPEPPALPALAELEAPSGRAVLERLVRKLGARRAAIAAELATGWRGPGGTPGESELARLLDLHGLARAFERRERDELLHALRAAGGVKTRAAERLGLDGAALDAAIARTGAAGEAERIREDRRAELRGRATLTERAHLFLEEAARLEDLGLRDEFAADLRARLPEHVRALRAGGAPLRAALAASLSLGAAAVDALTAAVGLSLGGGPADPAAGGPGRAPFGGGHRTPTRRSAGGARPASRGGPRAPRPASAAAGAAPRPDRRDRTDRRERPGAGRRPGAPGARAGGAGRGSRPPDRRGPGAQRPADRGAGGPQRPADRRAGGPQRPPDRRAGGPQRPAGRPAAGGARSRKPSGPGGPRVRPGGPRPPRGGKR